MVVMTIIIVMVALLLPTLQTVKERSRRVVCMNNMKQIALSLHLYWQFGLIPNTLNTVGGGDSDTAHRPFEGSNVGYVDGRVVWVKGNRIGPIYNCMDLFEPYNGPFGWGLVGQY